MWRHSGLLLVGRSSSRVSSGSAFRPTHRGSSSSSSGRDTSQITSGRSAFSSRMLRPIRWLIANAMPLALCQLMIEASLTGVCSWMLLSGKTSGTDIKAWLQRCHYPFAGLVDWDGGRHAEDWTVAGKTINAATLTALHTGHNIVSGLLPLQLLILTLMYPAWMRAMTAIAAMANTSKTPLLMWMMCARRRLTKALGGSHSTTRGGSAKPASCHPFGKQMRHRR